VSIVLPAYNEEDRLPAGLDRVTAFLAEQPFHGEIVVADDGSRDRTPDIVRERIPALNACKCTRGCQTSQRSTAACLRIT
jgi:glycosyltransferase involved in cell wall biosynthesis